MRPAALLLGVLPALAACGEPSAPGTPPPDSREAMARSYLRVMKSLDLQYENLQADLAARKPAEEVRKRLGAIRSGAETASRLPYRPSEAENRDLAFEFRKFLSAMDRLERAEWSGDEGLRSWRAVGVACASCHNLYRKDEEKSW